MQNKFVEMDNKEIRFRIYEALLKLPRYESIEDVSVDVDTIFSDIARVDAPEHIMENYYRLQAIKSTRPLTESEDIELNLTSKYIKPYYKSSEPISPLQETVDLFIGKYLGEEAQSKYCQ